MVPKLHSKGSSFRGAAAYLLHDKGQATSAERVEWTEVKNLVTGNPHTAWKVMAATAMDADRLKAAAGVKNTGRKSKDAVLHLTLSWHPDEAEGLTREEMLRAAHGAIRALKADDHQVLIVSHGDEPQKHVHVLINRVNPADGRMLSSSKEKLALSRWAERYEKERGKVYCPERVVNNAARDRGEFVRGEPDEARHLFEMKAANANDPAPPAVAAEQTRKDAAVSKKARAIKARCRAALRAVDDAHRQRIADIRAKARKALAVARQAIHARFKPERLEKIERDAAERQAFDEREKNTIGRIQNAWKAIDFKKVIRGKLRELFTPIADEGARLAALKRQQAAGDEAISARQRQAGRVVAGEIRDAKKAELAEARGLYLKERQSMELTNAMDAAALRADWKHRREQRRLIWWRKSDAGDVGRDARPPADVREAFNQAAALPPSGQGAAGDSSGDAKARRIEENIERMRKAREERKGRKPGRHL